MKRGTVLIFLLALSGTMAKGQDFAIKTNVLGDAFMNVSVGAEVALAPRWTLDLGWQFNNWTLSHDRQWKHWDLMPEARYWFCNRFAGHFLGVHAFTGQYNFGGFGRDFKFLGTDYSATLDNRFQGWFAGLGVGYGYDWILGRHWNLEAELGVGYARCTYDRFECSGCGRKLGSGGHDYFGLTKLAVSIVYLF